MCRLLYFLIHLCSVLMSILCISVDNQTRKEKRGKLSLIDSLALLTGEKFHVCIQYLKVTQSWLMG